MPTNDNERPIHGPERGSGASRAAKRSYQVGRGLIWAGVGTVQSHDDGHNPFR